MKRLSQIVDFNHDNWFEHSVYKFMRYCEYLGFNIVSLSTDNCQKYQGNRSYRMTIYFGTLPDYIQKLQDYSHYLGINISSADGFQSSRIPDENTMFGFTITLGRRVYVGEKRAKDWKSLERVFLEERFLPKQYLEDPEEWVI